MEIKDLKGSKMYKHSNPSFGKDIRNLKQIYKVHRSQRQEVRRESSMSGIWLSSPTSPQQSHRSPTEMHVGGVCREPVKIKLGLWGEKKKRAARV